MAEPWGIGRADMQDEVTANSESATKSLPWWKKLINALAWPSTAREPLQITYDEASKPFIWQAIEPAIKNRACPFCRQRLSIASFAGAFHYKGEPRLLHDSLPCLIEYSHYRSEHRLSQQDTRSTQKPTKRDLKNATTEATQERKDAFDE